MGGTASETELCTAAFVVEMVVVVVVKGILGADICLRGPVNIKEIIVYIV